MSIAVDTANLFSFGQARLGRLREDVQLQAAPRGLDGAPYWNLFDPVRNRFFRIGWLEFEMLSRWQVGMTVDQLCAAICQETVLQAQAEDVAVLIQFLQASELLHAANPALRRELLQKQQQQQQSIWTWALHNYLFFRIPLLRPDAFLRRTQHLLAFIFQPGFFYCMGLLAAFGVWRVLDQWSAFSATFLYFFSWQGLALYGVALVLTKTIHEFAHAYTARHFGLKIPTMGVAFMLLWPLLYTDTSEGWKLTERRARLAIGGAGVVAELLLAGVAALLWSVLPDGILKSAVWVLAAVTWISTLAINLNPFMRFDGYYLLMDALDMPNLHQRCFAFGTWHLRRLLLGVDDPVPESEHESRRYWLIGFAWLTWLYRLVLFTGIAVAVYYFFFKLAGVILFAIEIGWFVLRPTWKEMQVWWKIRKRWRTPRVLLNLSGLVLLFILMALPWRNEIAADGYAQAQQHTRIYPNMGAQVKQVMVKQGQRVRQGELLFVLYSPEIEGQQQAWSARRAGLQAQLERAIGNPGLMERLPLWQQELQASESMLQSLQEENERLQIRAPHDGVVRDLEPGLYPGAWVSPRHMLARVVDARQIQAQVFVSETEVARIQPGASAIILLRRADGGKIAATVLSIDRTATRVLPHVMLSSGYGGPLAARHGERGAQIANEALYRVTLKVADADPATSPLADHLQGLRAHIEAAHSSPLLEFGREVLGVVVRESGF